MSKLYLSRVSLSHIFPKKILKKNFREGTSDIDVQNYGDGMDLSPVGWKKYLKL